MTQRGADGLYEFLNALDDQAIIKQIIDGSYVSQAGKSFDDTHMSSPPRITNRHERRKAAKLKRGK